jgi:folate-binding protein YgfZ
VYLKLANPHYLLINRVTDSITCWTELITHGLQIQDSQFGQFLDLNAGLAWLDNNTSEEYIPQMLNLDKLGGISLTKGCYTGQEVVARTHYLGKAKRELYLAESETDAILAADNSVIDETGQVVGKILTWQSYQNTCRMLLVMQTTEIEATQLRLNNAKHDKISLISFATH